MKKELVNKLFQGFYPIVDVDYNNDISAYSLAESFLEMGFPLLQLRQKSLSKSEFRDLAMELVYLKIHNDFRFILNHHVDLVKQIGADGVHLTYQSISIQEARKLLGEEKIIGKSVHHFDEAKKAIDEGVDYLISGPIFPTNSKPKDYPLFSEDDIKKLMSEADIPILAIGGIQSKNIQEVKNMGFNGFCALSKTMKPDGGSLAHKLQLLWE